VGFDFGNWSLEGLSNILRIILGIKTHYVEKYFIPLKRS
jgi:hypothetical protein